VTTAPTAAQAVAGRRREKPMNDSLLWIGRLAGIAGALACLVAVAVRAGGSYWLAGLQVGTLLLGGIGAMVAGCFCLLWVLVSRVRASG
jgi:hypothetical protein